MSAKATITADFPTPKDVASRLRIPAKRAAELRQQVVDLQTRKDGTITVIQVKSPRRAGSSLQAKKK